MFKCRTNKNQYFTENHNPKKIFTAIKKAPEGALKIMIKKELNNPHIFCYRNQMNSIIGFKKIFKFRKPFFYSTFAIGFDI